MITNILLINLKKIYYHLSNFNILLEKELII